LDRKGEEGCGDEEAAAIIREIAKKATATKSRDSKLKEFSSEVLISMLREHIHRLRAQVKELVNRLRSVRYFKVVREAQRQGLKVDCVSCGAKNVKLEDQAVLSCCGHVGCKDCLFANAEKQHCAVERCNAPARVTNVLLIPILGTDKDYTQNAGTHGTVLRRVVDIIKSKTAKDEYVIVFVQFEDLLAKVRVALKEAGIGSETVQGSVYTKTTALSKFQEDSKDCPKVLLLQITDQGASGANLTKINHAILVHTLYTETAQEYFASETQAIGRIKRYGQERLVHIWRILAKDTMDTKIYEERTKGRQTK